MKSALLVKSSPSHVPSRALSVCLSLSSFLFLSLPHFPLPSSLLVRCPDEIPVLSQADIKPRDTEQMTHSVPMPLQEWFSFFLSWRRAATSCLSLTVQSTPSQVTYMHWCLLCTTKHQCQVWVCFQSPSWGSQAAEGRHVEGGHVLSTCGQGQSVSSRGAERRGHPLNLQSTHGEKKATSCVLRSMSAHLSYAESLPVTWEQLRIQLQPWAS